MDKQGFDVSILGDTIHFERKGAGFLANISFEWAKSHGFVTHSSWLTDLLYSKVPDMAFLVQPSFTGLSFNIFARPYKEAKNCSEAQGGRTVQPETIKAIEAILSKGDRVELIPVKDGVKVMQVQRKEIK